MTIDDDLAEQFETYRTSRGYGNRSEALRDLIRDRLGAEELDRPEASDCLATLTYVYNHQQRELAARMTRLSHEHHDLSVSTLHVHLDHDNCLETVVLRGLAQRVRAFADAIRAETGVRHARLFLLPVRASELAHGHGDAEGSARHLHLEPMS
ncbi:nickel-responsive transcriptional regulator NikR [Thiorhodovibrio winogradskyi]